MLEVFGNIIEVQGRKFAILIDRNEKRAYEAVYDEQNENWNTDFTYEALGIDSFEVAGQLDFEAAEKTGYKFE